MKTKTDNEYRIRKRGAAALVLAIIFIAVASYGTGAVISSVEVTVAETTTTQLEVTTHTEKEVSSFTMTSYIDRTETTYETVTQMGPDIVLVSGAASSKGVGTTAKLVLFLSASKNQTLSAQVEDGKYAINLPNRDLYNVSVEYGTLTADVGAGKCSAGGLVLHSLEASLEADWSC